MAIWKIVGGEAAAPLSPMGHTSMQCIHGKTKYILLFKMVFYRIIRFTILAFEAGLGGGGGGLQPGP